MAPWNFVLSDRELRYIDAEDLRVNELNFNWMFTAMKFAGCEYDYEAPMRSWRKCAAHKWGVD